VSELRRKLFNLLHALAVLLLIAGVLAVVWLYVSPYAHPWFLRFISEVEPIPPPPPEAIEQFRKRQDDIGHGADRGPFRCTLSPGTDAIGDHPPNLSFGLTNRSASPVTIWYTTWPHVHVTFLVRDQAGEPVASFRWGTLSSWLVRVDPETGQPTTRLPTQTWNPGETYTTMIPLQALREGCNGRPKNPGRYRIEAVFVYSDLGGWPAPNQDFVARSQSAEVEVRDPQSGDKFRAWRLR
jgi:hypothetical protein